jgi:hypothetical protein
VIILVVVMRDRFRPQQVANADARRPEQSEEDQEQQDLSQHENVRTPRGSTER